MFTSLIITTVITALAIASPAPRALPSGDVTCGRNVYIPSPRFPRPSSGSSEFNSHAELPFSADSYPHEYFVESSEHIELFCSGSSFLEYPILPGGVAYSGGSPGADRVVFTTSGTYCVVITHTGAATEDGFMSCEVGRGTWSPLCLSNAVCCHRAIELRTWTSRLEDTQKLLDELF
ncbi:Ribonuclease/ribotoxin [Mycena olivaceomarginata]|nr:Ribonuclease/ribotoxin [Mycena olivaceomarginata]